ncbi:MAG TPA: hypothetical protein VF755_17675, partial [Catenuloplanes sp.]
CDAAVDRLVASGARTLLVVGPDAASPPRAGAGPGAGITEYAHPLRGSFAPWGVPLEVTVGRPAGVDGPQRLPLSLLVAAWLLRRVPRAGARDLRMLTVDRSTSPAGCAAIGTRVGSGTPWALLVMGDGSACRGPRAPGYDDPRAAPYDTAVARALAEADAEALAGLDPDLSAGLQAVGRAPWQVLAAAVRAAGGPWRGDLTYHAAPYGVAYFVANWEPA